MNAPAVLGIIAENALRIGHCDAGMTPSTTTVSSAALAGFGDDFFNGPWYIQVIKNANAIGSAPSGERRTITDYVSTTGTFTTDAFSSNIEENDIILVLHESQVAEKMQTEMTAALSAYDPPTKAEMDAAFATISVDPSFDIGGWGFGGNGADGSKTVSASENLASGIYQYTDLTINASQILGCSDTNNAALVLLVQGTLTLGDGASITMEGKGAVGGNGGSGANGYVGYQGGYPFGSASIDAVANCIGGAGGAGGGNGNRNGGHGGGAGNTGGTGDSGAGNPGNATEAMKLVAIAMGNKDIVFESFGAGGGGGGGTTSAGGKGGTGGGFLYIECNELVLGTGGTIDADGANGVSIVTGTGSGGGGGGGGGICIVRCSSFTGDRSNVTANGGAGGDGYVGGSYSGTDGGTGATGYALIT